MPPTCCQPFINPFYGAAACGCSRQVPHVPYEVVGRGTVPQDTGKNASRAQKLLTP